MCFLALQSIHQIVSSKLILENSWPTVTSLQRAWAWNSTTTEVIVYWGVLKLALLMVKQNACWCCQSLHFAPSWIFQSSNSRMPTCRKSFLALVPFDVPMSTTQANRNISCSHWEAQLPFTNLVSFLPTRFLCLLYILNYRSMCYQPRTGLRDSREADSLADYASSRYQSGHPSWASIRTWWPQDTVEGHARPYSSKV